MGGGGTVVYVARMGLVLDSSAWRYGSFHVGSRVVLLLCHRHDVKMSFAERLI